MDRTFSLARTIVDQLVSSLASQFATMTTVQNLNFAVPINWAKRYLGSTPSRSLAEVGQESTVVQRLLSGSVSVPAGQTRNWPLTFNPNVMSAAELHGEVRSKGGLGGQC